MPRKYDVTVRRYLRGLGRREDIETLLRECNLTAAEEKILRMYYVEHVEDLRAVADFLGYSYSTVAKKHTAATKRLLCVIAGRL